MKVISYQLNAFGMRHVSITVRAALCRQKSDLSAWTSEVEEITRFHSDEEAGLDYFFQLK
jgi:hypothetical protein